MTPLKCGDLWAGDATHGLTPVHVFTWVGLLNSWNVLVTELGTVGETVQEPLFLCSHGLSQLRWHSLNPVDWVDAPKSADCKGPKRPSVWLVDATV